MTLTDALAAALAAEAHAEGRHYWCKDRNECGLYGYAEPFAAAILADPAFREALTAALAEAMPGPSGRWGRHPSWAVMDELERALQTADAAAIVAAMLP